MRLTPSFSLAVFGLSFLSLNCGGPSSGGGGCHYETWQGKCNLMGVRTARMVERFPKSYVVIESTYEPQSREGMFAPPPFRRETLAPAEQEADLTNHIKQHASVDCAVQNPVGDPCAPKMSAAIPEFIASAVQAPTGPVGCAKIEHGNNTPVPASAQLPGPFQFDENSSVASPEALRMADEAARAILQNPHIECVAIRGMSAPGENFSLANDRAQAVRHLLETRGVAHANVTVFEATAPTHTAAPNDDQPVLSEHRRVHLSVVVYGNGP